MSFFPQSYITSDYSSFPPIIRLLDEFDQYSRGTDRATLGSSLTKSFTPKFDVKELQDAYHLHGELPGIEQKDVQIEFTDASTLTIKGRSERSYSREAKGSGGNSTNTVQKKSEQGTESEDKFWVMERSVGEFSRSFSFPTQVDQDGVKASMKNGLLSVVVPKMKKLERRKIIIE